MTLRRARRFWLGQATLVKRQVDGPGHEGGGIPMAGKADFHAHLLRWMEMTKKHNMFYIFGPKMAHKRIVLMFFFFGAQKNGKWMSSTLLLVFSNYSFQQLLIRDISRMYTTSISFFLLQGSWNTEILATPRADFVFFGSKWIHLAGETAAGHVP